MSYGARIFYTLIISIFVIAITQPLNQPAPDTEQESIIYLDDDSAPGRIIIDSCEYTEQFLPLDTLGHYKHVLKHKTDCSNPRCKK